MGLSKVKVILDKLGGTYDSSTSFLLEKDFKDYELRKIESVMGVLLGRVYTVMEDSKYDYPPFYEEKVGRQIVTYLSIDNEKYILFSGYGDCIRRYSEFDRGERKVKYYLSINTEDEASKILKMGRDWE